MTGPRAMALAMTALLALQDAGRTPPRPPRDDVDLRRWLENMVWYHHYSIDEAARATGLGAGEVEAALRRFEIRPETRPARPAGAAVLALPYPGGRHPRIGFLDGAIDPQRETKASLFAPWGDGSSYAVVDVPEAVFTNLGLTYLAHTHVRTIWEEKGVTLEPLEWTVGGRGVLTLERRLPNGIVIGSRVEPTADGAQMTLTLTNGTDAKLTGMRAQVCVMLKGMEGFDAQTNDNKVIRGELVGARDEAGRRWVITAWRPLNRAWANPPVPCLHSDPALPDCAPGVTVKAEGRLWFVEGTEEAVFRRVEGEWNAGR